MGPAGCLYRQAWRWEEELRQEAETPEEGEETQSLGGERLRDGETENQRNLETGRDKERKKGETRARETKMQRWGDRDTRTEGKRRCSTDIQVPGPSDGHTQTRP